jgi:hypothetical protein
MAVKFRCTKCGRKFVEWGVNKVKSGDACEDCHGEYLEQVGYDAAQAAPRKKPALKRKRARVPVEAAGPALTTYDDDTTVAPDLDTLTTPDSGGNVDEVDDFDNTAEVESDAAEESDEEDEVEPTATDAEEVEEPEVVAKDDDE